MGNSLNGMTYYLGYTNEEKNPLEEYYNKLKQDIDKNNDNIITKEELEEYIADLTKKIDKNNDNLITKEEINEYIMTATKNNLEEIEKWKQAYDELNEKYENLLESMTSGQPPEQIDSKLSAISTQALKNYIKTEIIEGSANLRLVPDPLERKIYLIVLKTLLMSLEGLFNTTSLDVLNHRISFAINPIPEKINKISKKN